MAIKHRKLFPSYAGNDTSPGACNPDVCDQICPYGCDSYPYFYDITPTPPPTLPPPATFSTSPGYHVSPYMIILVTVLSSLFLLVSYYVIIVKYFSSWIFFPRLPRRTQPGGTGEDFLDENHGPAIDHPIWYIPTVGLQPSVIDSITVFPYKKRESLIDGTTCSVCLTEFQDDETLRLLPKCNHAFHIRCIDTWLRSHTNCPLCRAVIVSNASAAAAPNSNSLSENQNYSNVTDLNQEDQSVNAENSDGSENNYVRDVEVCEFRAGTEDEIEIPQRVRRSVSMDILGGNSSSRMTIESEGSCSVDPNTDKQGSDVDENSGIFRMMRSFSYGGRSFLLKHSNRNP